MKPEDASNENERYLILTMPEVNEDRHDELIDAVDVLYDGCKVQMDKTVASYRVKLEPKILPLPSDEQDEAQNALDSSVKNHLEMIDKLKAEKLKEIEEAYQAYLDRQQTQTRKEEEEKAARGDNAGLSYRFNAEDE